MDYIPLSDNAARQVIDSTTIFHEYFRAQAQARPYAGGMYWKRQNDYEYLVKTQPDNRQSRVGPRSADTEKIYEDFASRKQELETRLKSLRTELKDAERLNKALKAGRTFHGGVAVADPGRFRTRTAFHRGRDSRVVCL